MTNREKTDKILSKFHKDDYEFEIYDFIPVVEDILKLNFSETEKCEVLMELFEIIDSQYLSSEPYFEDFEPLFGELIDEFRLLNSKLNNQENKQKVERIIAQYNNDWRWYVESYLDDDDAFESCLYDLNNEEKEELYKRRLEEYDTANYNYEYALFLEELGRFEEAKFHYNRAIENDDEDLPLNVYTDYGTLLLEHFNEPQEAKKLFETAIALYPDFDTAYSKLAEYYLKVEKDSAKAQNEILKAFEINPNNIKYKSELEKYLNKSTFVSEIEISKVRHLKDINILISKDKRKHLFLTGKNGSGKTSFLEEAENHFQRIIEISKNEITTKKGESEFWGFTNDFPLKFSYKPTVLNLRLKYESGNYTIAFFKDERKLKGLEKVESIVPIEFKAQALPKENYSQKLVTYLIWQDYKKKSDINNQQIEQFFVKIQSILKRVYKDNNLRFEIDLKGFEFGKSLNFNILLSDGNCFNFENMAAGYSSVFRIIFELILRMEAKPEKENTEGIVLIDEPETHLHVEMQKEIMPILIEMFPNVQFIVATHSPFILNSVENAVVFDLGKKILVENMSGYSYDSIIENYYDSDKYSQIVKAKLEEYEKLYFKNNLSGEEEERLLDLKIYFKDIPKFLSPELSVKLQQIHSSKITRL